MDTTEHVFAHKSRKKNDLFTKAAAGFAAAIVVGGLGFFGGVHYQKGQKVATTASANAAAQFGGTAGGSGAPSGGNFMRRGSGSIGSVTAVSSTSITVNDTRANTTKTYSISSSTVVTNGGASASVSDIQTGDTVFVTTSGSTSTDATRIMLNPSTGGFTGTNGTADPGSDSSTNNIQTN